ncbi:MAG TPA: glycosyltransferase family 2 protein, partial [Prolixibacteraceae bacterium]|nr:glycosyltransferase family 2 protein [Prolixibacteraceae bacterium]
MKMIEKTVGKEIKRLWRLTFLTYKLFGFRFLLKEIKRYLLYGPLEVVPTYTDYPDDSEYCTREYSPEEISSLMQSFHIQPKITIITPVYNVDPEFLDACIDSVKKQHYTKWELCLYDDCSTRKETRECLKKWIKRDKRIKIQLGEVNRHISHASNEAIKMAGGDFIGLLDNDDELSPDALLEVVKTINEIPDIDFIYSDEDMISPEGSYFQPHYKTDFNRSLLLSHNYVTHFAVIRKGLGDSLGWFREGYEGAQDHDLFLRIIDKTNRIYHIPKILYHWRQSATSTSLNYREKFYADAAARKALSDYARRNGIIMELHEGPGLGVYRFKREIVTDKKVSIIVPFKDQVPFLKDCIESVTHKTRYHNWELLLVSNNSEEEETFRFLKKVEKNDKRIRVLEYNHPFNFSAINNWAVKQSTGSYILLLNNDIKAISDGWLEAMLEHIQQESVGIVGAKLLYSDNTIQHAGVIIGILGVAGHSHRFCPDASVGYYYRSSVIQELSAVTGACLLTKRDLWDQAGGLDETNLKIAFNDIDYCLKIRELGYDVVYTPYAKLYHYESKSRGAEDTPEKQQ